MKMDIRAQLIASERGQCRHFNGTQRETCRAGVEYRALVGGPDLGWGLRLPCGLRLRISNSQVDEPVTCDQFSAYTEEELANRADSHVKRMDDFSKAVKVAREDAKAHGLQRGHGGAGSVPCPVCAGGTLHYTVASVNGHMWGKCSTKDCMSWME